MFKHIQPWARPAVMAFLIIAATMILAYIASALWGAEDVREWIGAFSGWAAALAAFAIGLPTLRALRDQSRIPILENEITSLLEKIDILSSFREIIARIDNEGRWSKKHEFMPEATRAAIVIRMYITAIEREYHKLPQSKRFPPLGDTSIWRQEINSALASQDEFDLKLVNRLTVSTIDGAIFAEVKKLKEEMDDLARRKSAILKM